MNLRFTALVLLVLVVLVGLVVYLNNKPAPESPSKLIFGTPPADIQKLTYQPANGPETVIQKQAERWRINSPITAWMDDYKAQNLINNITQLAYLAQIQADASGSNSLAANGLAPPQAVLTFTDQNGHNYALNIGQQDAQGRLYVTTDRTPGLMDVVDGSWLSPLTQSPDNLRDMTLANFQPELVQSVTITAGGKTSLITQNENSAWTLTQPVKAPIDTSKIQDWLNTLQGLTAQSFAPDAAASEGFKHGLGQIDITFSAQVPSVPQAPLEIKLGSYTDLTEKNIYVESSQNPGAAVVDAGILTQLDVNALRDHAVLHMDANGAARIDVHWNVAGKPGAGGNWFLIRNKQGNWKAGDSEEHFGNGPLAATDLLVVQSLLSKLAGLQADQFVDNPNRFGSYGLSPPWMTIDIQIPGRTQDVKLDIGWPLKSGYTAFKTLDWPSIYLVKTANAGGLSPNDWKGVILKPVATMSATTAPATEPATAPATIPAGE